MRKLIIGLALCLLTFTAVAENKGKIEIPLRFDESIAQRKVLRHSYEGVIDRGVAVRVVFTHTISNDPCRFFVRFIVFYAEFLHCIKNAAMHRLEAVTGIG